MADLQTEIMARVRELLTAKELSDAQFSRILREEAPWTKASKTKVSNWFSGAQELGVRELKEIARVLGVSLAELVLGKKDSHSAPPKGEAEPEPVTPEVAIRVLAEREGLEVRRRRAARKNIP